MNILRPGHLPKEHKEYRGTCRVCNCMVSCQEGDRNLKEGYSGMDAQHGYYVVCPTKGCTAQIHMEKVAYRGGSKG